MNALLEFINEKLSSRFTNREFNTPKLRNDGQAVFDYDFMMSLDPKDYPKYLCQAYNIKTGQKLNLKHPKSLNEKIQWLKIYDNIPIKATLTDKILVRDWVKERIGEEYLKPVLQICNSFDEIDFENLPESFIIKCNHGCKWHAIIKNKHQLLENKALIKLIKEKFDNWLIQSFFGYSDFEPQYLNIEPKIIIEPLMREDINIQNEEEFWVWCVNSESFIGNRNREFREEALKLSSILSKDFKFVRVDWMTYKGKLYFEEMTFTPFSGYLPFNSGLDKIFEEISKKLKI